MMLDNEIKAIIQQFPEVVPHLTGYAAWLAMESELRAWEQIAVEHARKGEPIACEYKSVAIPDGVKDTVLMMLGYADCENCVHVVFEDVLKDIAKADSMERHKKIPYRGDQPYVYTPGTVTITQKDVDKAIRQWDKFMPEFAGMLEATVEQENENA